MSSFVLYYEYSTPELVRISGERFKEYGMRCNLTQKEVSGLSGVGLECSQGSPKAADRRSDYVDDIKENYANRYIQR